MEAQTKLERSTEKVAIYIDGSNFYKYLKDKEIAFPKGTKFSFTAFIEFLARNRNCVSKRYYVGIVRNIDHTKKSADMVRGQQKFLAHLENEGFVIKRGRVMYDSGKIREKGADVKLAVDLVVGAFENLYDTTIVVSSDTDLIPAIKYAKYRQKKIEYVGFSHSPSLGMQKYADFSILLLPEHIEKFKEIK